MAVARLRALRSKDRGAAGGLVVGPTLDDVVAHFGSQEAAYVAIQQAAQKIANQSGVTGVFKKLAVEVGGFLVNVSGNVIDGIVHIGTAALKK